MFLLNVLTKNAWLFKFTKQQSSGDMIQIQSPAIESIYCRNTLDMSKDISLIEILFD